MQGELLLRYRDVFHETPEACSFAPGRVELLGNHTDYNGGLVLTAAIHQGITLLGNKRTESLCRIHSLLMNETAEFDLTSIQPGKQHGWASYCKGVVHELQNAGVGLGGFDALIDSTLPMGAGVSSSAALELATLMLLRQLYAFDMEKMEAACLCQKVENEFVGLPCGLLDQFSSMFGKRNHALMLDCLTLENEAVAFPDPAPMLVLCQTGVKHKLIESEYSTRSQECTDACRMLAANAREPYSLLRDVPLDVFHTFEDKLPLPQRNRARHVLQENWRVQQGVLALKNHNLREMGRQMFESHSSSRDWFENSCPELDFLVDEATRQPGCFGAKLTGGGFGGATVNLVDPADVDDFIHTMQHVFEQQFGVACETMLCTIGDGAWSREI